MVAVTSHRDDFPRLRISAKRWHEMIAKGIIGEDERLELLEGEIHVMTPPNAPHGVPITRLLPSLIIGIDEKWVVICQTPLSLGQDSEPQPDIAVVEAREISDQHHPRSARLVVEVSDSSLALDRALKLRLYARAGVPEYWIVIVEERQMEVYREPVRKTGLSSLREVVTAGEVVRSTVLPKVRVPVKSLFR